MSDWERVQQEIQYQLKTGKLISYFTQEDFGATTRLLETVDKKGNVSWRYFSKTTGQEVKGY